MRPTFIGRNHEINMLQGAYEAEGSGFIPIYGRRRVGKSELILHFLHNKAGIYHLGKQAQAGLQKRELLQAAATLLSEPLLTSLESADWGAILSAIVDRWRQPEKLILALDEFQWIVDSSPELPSVLQELWDRHWKRRGKLLLILCGSYVGFMEREVLGRRSPLFGRRTAQIHLKPFGYREAAHFHPQYSLVDRARTYFICGGVPLYLQAFSSHRSVERNIVDNLLSEFAPLYHEPDFLLREELRDVENYYAILMAVAAGFTSYRAVAEQTRINTRNLNYYLHQLSELGYLIRRHPVSGRPPAQRHVRYALDDPLLRFWFRFVYPHTSLISQLGGTRAFQELIRPNLDAYFGSCFERLCREALPTLYARQGVSAAYEVGEYWDKNAQIDVVGLRQDSWTDLGECKWGPVHSAAAVEKELEEKISHYPNQRGATLGRMVFARRRPKQHQRSSKIQWYTLEDL